MTSEVVGTSVVASPAKRVHVGAVRAAAMVAQYCYRYGVRSQPPKLITRESTVKHGRKNKSMCKAMAAKTVTATSGVDVPKIPRGKMSEEPLSLKRFLVKPKQRRRQDIIGSIKPHEVSLVAKGDRVR